MMKFTLILIGLTFLIAAFQRLFIAFGGFEQATNVFITILYVQYLLDKFKLEK